jgi:hypothetical protein
VHTPEDVEFVREQLVKYLYVGVLEPAEWDRALQAAEVADLNDDDSPEIFVMVVNSLCCGSLGCRGILLQKL